MLAIYHTIVTLKTGPLNVSQSNLASGTVHRILFCRPSNLSCVTQLAKREMLKERAEKRRKLTLRVAFQSCVIYSGVRMSRGC